MSSLRDQLFSQLMDIRSEHGFLTPEIVKEAARPKTHPLHGRSCDKAPKDAAEAYYTQKAHDLIQHVRISFTGQDGRPKTTRGLVATQHPDSPRPVYEPINEVVQDPLRRKILLQQMERDWRTLRARYQDVEEFAALVLGDLEGAA